MTQIAKYHTKFETRGIDVLNTIGKVNMKDGKYYSFTYEGKTYGIASVVIYRDYEGYNVCIEKGVR